MEREISRILLKPQKCSQLKKIFFSKREIEIGGEENISHTEEGFFVDGGEVFDRISTVVFYEVFGLDKFQ